MLKHFFLQVLSYTQSIKSFNSLPFVYYAEEHFKFVFVIFKCKFKKSRKNGEKLIFFPTNLK